MEFLDISTDVLAIKCVENYIFVGMEIFISTNYENKLLYVWVQYNLI